MGPFFISKRHLLKKLLTLLILAISPLFADTTFTGGNSAGDIHFSLTGPGDNWQLIHQQSIEGGETIAEYIPADETLDDWTSMVTIMYLPVETDLPASRLVYAVISELKRECRRAEWSFIAKERKDATYEWSVDNYPGRLYTQHEIARLVQAGEGWFRISYVKKVPRLSDEERENWIEAICSAVQS